MRDATGKTLTLYHVFTIFHHSTDTFVALRSAKATRNAQLTVSNSYIALATSAQ